MKQLVILLLVGLSGLFLFDYNAKTKALTDAQAAIEHNQISELQRQIQQLKQERDQAEKQANQLPAELTRQIQQLTKERDQAKTQADQAQVEITRLAATNAGAKNWLQKRMEENKPMLSEPAKVTPGVVYPPRYWIDGYGYRHYYY